MIFDKIVELVKDRGQVDGSAFTMDTKLSEMGLDSLDRVELVMALEEEYNVQIELDETLVSMKDLVGRIQELCKEQGRDVQ